MISVLVTLIVLGVILYIVGLIPMDNTLRRIIQALAILFVCLWLLQVLGVWSGFPGALRR
jgi:hypothetical protein